jgi:hypothetical protein
VAIGPLALFGKMPSRHPCDEPIARCAVEDVMSGPYFDSWTRRRFGLVAGALATSRIGAADLTVDAKKKHKHKKKRCKKLGESCTDGGRRCCNGRTCGGNPANGTFCCKQGGTPCSKNRDCCNEQCFEGACALN